jgi:hypothetical protein
MNDELGRMRKEAAVAYLKVLINKLVVFLLW